LEAIRDEVGLAQLLYAFGADDDAGGGQPGFEGIAGAAVAVDLPNGGHEKGSYSFGNDGSTRVGQFRMRDSWNASRTTR
jgi:hypothetical protein